MDAEQRYLQATQRTAGDLRTIAESRAARELSHLSLPEIETLTELVAQVVPAGNVPGMILNGLLRLSGRRQMADVAHRDVNMLLKGVEQVLDAAVYSTFFAGPAAVLWGYRNLLKLAGKPPEDFFPDGAWQFYVEYALREDTARHAVETYGFDTGLARYGIHLSAVDRLTSWAMACIHCLHNYQELLKNEWREKVYLNLLIQVTKKLPEADSYVYLSRLWENQRPYARSADVGDQETYALYRRRKFDELLEGALSRLPADVHREWVTKVQTAKEHDLPLYLRQMSVLARLVPDTYNETRQNLRIEQAHVGVIWRGKYTLIPACQPGTSLPADVQTVRVQIGQLMSATSSGEQSEPLLSLARLRRASWPRLMKQLNSSLASELDVLGLAPILLNGDPRSRNLPLAELRQAERGIGSHAVTIFDTSETFVFDMSHIFFDGLWGASLAEILTNEALAWGTYLHDLPLVGVDALRPRELTFCFTSTDLESVAQAQRVTFEVSVENNNINIRAILTLRKLFERRNERIRLTVNDFLLLYRAIHAATYKPDPELMDALKNAAASNGPSRPGARAALEAIELSGTTNPAVLIPIDASQRGPRERLYPMNFDVPLKDLNLLELHANSLKALDAYQESTSDREKLYDDFDQYQRTYLATLAGFGEVVAKAKRIAASGEDTSIGVLKLVGVLPTPIQHLLEKIPQRSDMLNDLIRGREVLSNLGAVAKSSSLVRFITAKDDNEQKSLAWGVITDAAGTLHISLRDFRPHVGLLVTARRNDLAEWVARDYLESYVRGLNDYLRGLRRITLASREK